MYIMNRSSSLSCITEQRSSLKLESQIRSFSALLWALSTSSLLSQAYGPLTILDVANSYSSVQQECVFANTSSPLSVSLRLPPINRLKKSSSPSSASIHSSSRHPGVLAHGLLQENFILWYSQWILTQGIRAKAMSMSTASNWLWNWTISYTVPYLVDTGPGNAGLGVKVFFIWGSTCLGCLVFTYFFIPETKGLSLEQVDELYTDGVKPWRSSDWVPETQHWAEVSRSQRKETKVVIVETEG